MTQQNLFIKWDDGKLVGFTILDEQHRGLVATINSLYYFIQQGWDLVSLKPTLKMLEQYVAFHTKTEELILVQHGISEEDLKIIREYDVNFLSELHKEVETAITEEQPNNVVKFLARWWLSHKTEFHDKLAKYLQE